MLFRSAVLSACSSLIAIIDDQGSKIVQFSHFSVKEYMTSDRLQTSDIGYVCDYYIPLESANTLLARACMAVLLQLDEKVDREQVATFPLSDYASKHWLDHAKIENVQSQIEDDLKHLFDPTRPHLRACIWVHEVDVKYNPHRDAHSAAKQPPPLRATPLYYAVLCGFSELAKWLIMAHAEDVNAECYDERTPLHAASQEGHVDAVHVLLDHGAYVNPQDDTNWTPLHFASTGGHLEVVRLLLEHKAALDAQSRAGNTPLYLALGHHLEIVRLLLSHGADVHIRGESNRTPFEAATAARRHDIAQLLLEHGAKRE